MDTRVWQKSSRCVGGDCVQVWRKSTRCDKDWCVEVAVEPGEVLVRDSKDPDGPVLRFTQDEWQAFLTGAKDGEFG